MTRLTNEKYILKKADRTVTLSKVEDKWNYRKEFGTALMDNFNFTEDKLVGFIGELKDIGYQVVEEPESLIVREVKSKNFFIKDQEWTKPDWDNFFSGTYNVEWQCLKLPDKYNEEYKKQIERDWNEWNEWNEISQPLTVLGPDFQPPTLQTMEVPSDWKMITLEFDQPLKKCSEFEINPVWTDFFGESVQLNKANGNENIFETIETHFSPETLEDIKQWGYPITNKNCTPIKWSDTITLNGKDYQANFEYVNSDCFINFDKAVLLEGDYVLTYVAPEDLDTDKE